MCEYWLTTATFWPIQDQVVSRQPWTENATAEVDVIHEDVCRDYWYAATIQAQTTTGSVQITPI